MSSMSRRATVVLTSVLLTAPLPAGAAQDPVRRGGVEVQPSPRLESPGQGNGKVVVAEENARETRERLTRLLQQYPSTLVEVLRRDPTLLRNDAYLGPYPSLAAFLSQHPEVAHNPAFFLGNPVRDPYAERDPDSQRINAVRDMFEGMTVLLGFMSLFALLGWVTKSIVDQRRWARVSKIQQEAHTKVIDRLTTNEDLMAYIQTPAGQRYLESAPLTTSTESPVSAPYSRILWSVQVGTVASLIGMGFLFVSARWANGTDWSADFSRMLFLVGTVALAAGIGFVLSGFASYGLSRRFGLIQSPASPRA